MAGISAVGEGCEFDAICDGNCAFGIGAVEKGDGGGMEMLAVGNEGVVWWWRGVCCW